MRVLSFHGGIWPCYRGSRTGGTGAAYSFGHADIIAICGVTRHDLHRPGSIMRSCFRKRIRREFFADGPRWGDVMMGAWGAVQKGSIQPQAGCWTRWTRTRDSWRALEVIVYIRMFPMDYEPVV